MDERDIGRDDNLDQKQNTDVVDVPDGVYLIGSK